MTSSFVIFSAGFAVATTDGMVRIAGGSFEMGSRKGLADERPPHRVRLKSFWIDAKPITNVEFAAFLQELGTTRTSDGRRLFDIDDEDARIRQKGKRFEPFPKERDHPVVEASWHGAVAYCRSKGKRLPSEAEWEFAARGREGRTYPWGNLKPSRSKAHYGRGWGETAPSGTTKGDSTPEGVMDMAGNVHEWTSSLARPYPYVPSDGRENLDASGDRVTRGGAADTGAETLRAAWRGASVSRNPNSGHHNIGFRCAKDAKP